MAVNSTVITCTMPNVELPSDFQVNDTDSVSAGGGVPSLSGGPHDRDHADVYVGLVFDGFRHYDNLTAAMTHVTFQFFEPPTIDKLESLITYRPQLFNDIVISVRLLFNVNDLCVDSLQNVADVSLTFARI